MTVRSQHTWLLLTTESDQLTPSLTMLALPWAADGGGALGGAALLGLAEAASSALGRQDRRQQSPPSC